MLGSFRRLASAMTLEEEEEEDNIKLPHTPGSVAEFDKKFTDKLQQKSRKVCLYNSGFEA